MQITFFSLFMSVIWSSALAIFNYFCRKKRFFIRQLGITNILFLYLFSVIRMIIPYEFSFTQVIPPQGMLGDICRDPYIGRAGTARLSFLTVLAVVWAAVSTVLILRFVFHYMKAMRGYSSYRLREDEQCKRVYNRVLNVSRTQMKIAVRSSADVKIPMGAGIFRRSILLPEETYSDSELYYILRHEYTHFQNRDLAIKILIHIYGCVFWWNPAIYLLKRDLAQVLEIKCDLDVTAGMQNRHKAEYLSTIVAMLRNAGTGRKEKAFYGAMALVSKDYESEIIERFKLVSASYGHKRNNALFTGSWFLVFAMLVFLSYSFVIRPDYEIPLDESVAGQEQAAGSSYSIECVDGTYYVHFR